MPSLCNLLFALLFVVILAKYEDMIFKSVNENVSDQTSFVFMERDLPPPDQIDFAINPVPKFGARAINITQTYFSNGHVIRHDYGYMPVKNATRRDPRVHVAYLTTSSEGWSMMEQGQVKGSQMTFHLKQYLRRSFDVGNRNDLEIREFERQFEMPSNTQIIMKVRAETNMDIESYTATYKRILG
ncbi:hypothetical protein DICVIV_02349 [Dictyocaulus viviparus]|uniref:THAP4-like heme-binding domain-containing protein n=1 Tax=Dictyocaulus viviparus TaxID=29172 RepID=A0A0D8YAA6_DICVI|nr:hypothetical protein DICVIV_02349 [Dictyocaulus viviparus]